MHAQPQRTLKRLLKQYGQELIDDPRRTEALLRDLCGQHTREIFVLVNAQRQRIPSDLLAAPAWMPRQATYSRLSRLLQTKLALTEDAADWAVAAWAIALDLEAQPKGESWSWIPTPLRTPPPASNKKSRSKKRQNTTSGVQYSKESPRKAAPRHPKERPPLMGWSWKLPKLPFSPPVDIWSVPKAWTNLLPWAALLTATFFLLAVVYWTSANRSEPVVDTASTEEGTAVTSIEPENDSEAVAQGVDPEVEYVLPSGSPREYLAAVMPLPASAQPAVDVLYVRREPTTQSEWIALLPAGQTAHVIAFSEDGEWSQIDQPSAGWVNNDFLLFQNDATASPSVYLNVHMRNTQPYEVDVHAAPDDTSEVLDTLAADTPVVVATAMGESIDEPASWYQIADPIVGWVAANDLAPGSP